MSPALTILVFMGVIAVTAAGYLADHAGWRTFFVINMALALPGMALLPFLPGTAAEEPEPTSSDAVGVTAANPSAS